ncbi:MAG: aminotransferase class V-fold PLP-dependent enzyme [Gammaproteobacteria bacterium]|nr:aminotransferase class V-fold PLP-dependent enzyme [Gammaproteobacteria bacterium]
MVDWDKSRREFPGLRDRIFLDAACVSLLPDRARRAVEEFGAQLVAPAARDATCHHIWMDGERDKALPQIAAMLGCRAEQLCLVESTTQGLNIAAQAIPWRRGDEVLMCDLEFLQVAIPFVMLGQSRGVKPVFVRHRNGVADVDGFRAALTSKTRAIVVSSTQWTNGYRIDLSGLAELARGAGAWLVVDGVQQAGAVPFQLEGIDFLVSGGHKWLNAPMGTGFLYLSERVLAKLDPACWGYLALDPPKGGWGNYFTTPTITPDREYRFVRTARRFETGGTANYPGAIALAKSVEIVNEAGIEAVAQRIWDLGDRLIDGLQRLDLRLETPFAPSNRAGIISFTLGTREGDRACVDHLLQRGIWVGQRYTSGTGGVRVSIHYFNNQEDLDRLIEELAAFLRHRITRC